MDEVTEQETTDEIDDDRVHRGEFPYGSLWWGYEVDEMMGRLRIYSQHMSYIAAVDLGAKDSVPQWLSRYRTEPEEWKAGLVRAAMEAADVNIQV